MKIISYSLFKGPDPLAEIFYIRGFYFNCLMNSLVYPDWKIVLLLDERYETEENKTLFATLAYKYGVHIVSRKPDTHCMMMLWRMEPIFWENSEYVICRDADALTSQREANAVSKFISYAQMTIHGISDNPAHSIPLMGGMSGFRCKPFREKYKSMEGMIMGWEGMINNHGTDQKFLVGKVYDDFKEDMMMHFGESSEHLTDAWVFHVANSLGTKSHGSDLCTSFIGAAGYNEMETLRFFRSHIPNWGSDQELWKQYPKIFYWHD